MSAPAGRRFPPRYGRVLAVALGLAVMLAVAWLAGRRAERSALADLDRQARFTLTIQAGALRAEMQRQSALPLALASDPEIAALLKAGTGAEPGLADRVGARLAAIAGATGAAVIYVIRPDGLTVAASNAGADGSFVGRNYAFRPYFRDALATGSGAQFALGTVSGRPGLYLARRIGDRAGVVVVKIEFDAVEAAWRAAGEALFVTDPRGIVLVASDPAWRFRTLRPIEPDAQARIRADLEFGDAPLAAMPLFPAADGLVRVGRGAEPARLALLREAPVAGTDWRIHSLTPITGAVARERDQARAIAVLATGLAGLGLAVWLGRRARTRARLREAAARGAELEARVGERTRALSAANARLRDEIAERRRSEAERERLGRELAQAGRLAALGQFAASMAHEINQPLAAIRSYADNTGVLVARGRVADAAENVAAIGRLTDRIGALTRQLKGFARRASGRREPVAVDALLRGVLEVVAARAEADGTPLAVEAAPDLAVIGDGARLEQVLVNLLQNALDAVAGRPVRRVAVSVASEGERVGIAVRDDGPGIPEAVRGQIFDPFFTTKADGLGLGLAISRGIVEECGGTLSVADAPGGGTVFRMDLVRAPGPGARAEAAEATA
ncbi:ATP-binding protein [Methylobacterium sp. NEAU 140]|uniref:sensor histidine kinase n=1 Tax=Methylobacterium sp. NEAU 140 TaxID=3064945 RepID=UPI0027374413|nr:ATP-binding protein [Methylobacterium sp. NEAU 140]MDP4021470.1 ATP-binding protein [Methylobacterium sp. NEAU 140]